MIRLISTLLAALLSVAAFAGKGYKAGDEAKAFSLKNIDGTMVALEKKDEIKGYIVVFTCNHCPYAKAYEDRINALHNKYKSSYPVIAINPNDAKAYPDDSFENMQKRAKEKGFTFPYLHDESQEIAKAYGATKTPHVYLIQFENDKPVVKYVGAIDDNYQDAKAVKKKYVEKAIADLKAGNNPETDHTIAIGCSIKWK